MKLLLVLLFIGLSSASPVAEGDAKPDAQADPWWGYYGYGGYPYWGWGGAYYGYPHYIGKRSADAEAAPEAAPAPAADAKADPWWGYGGYWGYPYSSYYYPAWGGYHLIGKRSADAEAAPEAAPAPAADAKADPWWGYGGYWGYPSYSSYYYPGWGGYHLIGKRSAEAEAAPAPAADAKADPWWPYYGGYYGYGYPAWGYGWGYNRYWGRK